MREIFEHLPEVYFFIKDHRSRFVHANSALMERLGIRDPEELIGTGDHDRYPPQVADQLIAGDRRIMESGEPLIDHLEVLFDRVGTLEWFSTSKYPILQDDGTPLGVVGVTRSYSARKNPHFNNQAAGRAMDFISENPTAPLRVADLAKRFGISERQLHRQFLNLVKLSPREFILRSRIQAAAADLRSSGDPISFIADKFGFCDQSSFTRQFRKVLGTTPAHYRQTT